MLPPNWSRKFSASVINFTAFFGVPKQSKDSTPFSIESDSHTRVPTFFSISNEMPSFLHLMNRSLNFYSAIPGWYTNGIYVKESLSIADDKRVALT